MVTSPTDDERDPKRSSPEFVVSQMTHFQSLMLTVFDNCISNYCDVGKGHVHIENKMKSVSNREGVSS